MEGPKLSIPGSLFLPKWFPIRIQLTTGFYPTFEETKFTLNWYRLRDLNRHTILNSQTISLINTITRAFNENVFLINLKQQSAYHSILDPNWSTLIIGDIKRIKYVPSISQTIVPIEQLESHGQSVCSSNRSQSISTLFQVILEPLGS